jgi:amino acid adenylation domain-containing protein
MSGPCSSSPTERLESPRAEAEITVINSHNDATTAHSRRSSQGVSIRPTAGFIPFSRDQIEQSIPARFAQQVERHPHRIAVKSARYSLSYAELDRWANRVAHALLAACGRQSVPIALFLERDAPQVAAILGVLKAGKIYVALAPSYPPARNQLIVDDSQTPILVTDNANLAAAQRLAGSSVSILNIDALDERLDDSDPRLAISPDDYAYLIYTSGSTGRPKGIAEIHRNVLHNIMNFTNDHYVHCHDRITGINSFAFSGSLKDIFGSLLNGGSMYPLEIDKVGLHGLARWLVEEEITILSLVSTTFRHLAGTLTGSEVFPRLRVIRIGSEEVTWKDVELFKALFPPDCVLVNGYGATETGTIATFMIDHTTEAVGGAVPIGYPVPGTEVLLLDDDGQPIGINQVGQIAVRSARLSPGYWGQPELTRNAFLPDHQGGDQRIYLTGDLGLRRPDGCLIHAGRKDFQVKIRGIRIEIAEIETALAAAPGIAEAVVVARDELPEDRCLAAYVVPHAGQAAPSAPRLREFLKRRLPDASIPSAFVVLDALPLTPSGKTDRSALPAPEQGRLERTHTYVAPRTALEERLTAIWEELTELRPIGVIDEFFNVGGNSLLAVRLFAEIHRALGKNLPVETVLTAPTIERLAEILAQAPESGPRPLVMALKADGSRLPFFLVPGSEGHPLSYYELARHGEPEQPYFGLQYPEPSPGHPYPTRIEDLAARFLPEILALQPQGPYRLGGHSFGGVVAFELAQQLTAMGHEVSVLALFDTLGKGYPALRPIASRIAGHLRRLRRLSLGGQLGYIARKTAGALARIGSSLRWPPVVPTATAPTESSPISLINHHAWCQYQPRTFPGRIVLFRADEIFGWDGFYYLDDPFKGWGDHAAGGIEVHTVPGDHVTLLDRKNVAALAQKLNSYLR